MDDTTAVKFLTCLGVNPNKLKKDGKWLRCSCPLARWTHAGGKDSSPSFGARLDGAGRLNYNCFACGGGTAEKLIQSLELYSQDSPQPGLFDFKTAHEILDTDKPVFVPLPEYGEESYQEVKTFKEWPAQFLTSFEKVDNSVEAKEYLYLGKDHVNAYGQKSRAFTPEECDRFGLRFDNVRKMVMFPFYDKYHRFAGVRGRSIREKMHYDYTWSEVNNSSLVWFNEQSLDKYPGWVVVVEGQFDAMRVGKRYPKVVANMTAKPTKEKLMTLLEADGTVLIPDNDAAGVTSTELYRQFHKKHDQPFQVLNLPSVCKDADDADSGYLYEQILETLPLYAAVPQTID